MISPDRLGRANFTLKVFEAETVELTNENNQL